MMFSLHSSNKTILSFIFINILLKVIPLYTIWNDKIYWKKDLCRIIMLFLIYICWSTLLGYNVFTQQMKMINAFKKGNPHGDVTPGMMLLFALLEKVSKTRLYI